MQQPRKRRRGSRLRHDPSLNLEQDRRRSIRQPANGEVVLVPAASGTEFRGTLRDVSAAGFRAAHSFTQLQSGQELLFWYEGLQGSARVVWSRIIGAEVESGFLVLESGPHPPH